MKHDLPKVIYGGVDEPQPDWRKENPDIDDDEDPVPFSDRLLREMHGFDPAELTKPSAEPPTQAAARKKAAAKARGKKHS